MSQSISFPPELLARAKERCAKLGLSFSAYVQKCIERDLAERGAIVFEEKRDHRTETEAREFASLPAVALRAKRKK